MLVFEAVPNAFNSESYEDEIRKGIDDFSGIDGSIVVLKKKLLDKSMLKQLTIGNRAYEPLHTSLSLSLQNPSSPLLVAPADMKWRGA